MDGKEECEGVRDGVEDTFEEVDARTLRSLRAIFWWVHAIFIFLVLAWGLAAGSQFLSLYLISMFPLGLPELIFGKGAAQSGAAVFGYGVYLALWFWIGMSKRVPSFLCALALYTVTVVLSFIGCARAFPHIGG